MPVSESPHRGLFAFLSFNRPGAAHQCFQDCLLVEKREFLLARCEGKDRGKTAAQYDHQFCPIGYEIDTASQRAKFIGGLCPSFFITELVVEGSNLLMIMLCQIGMEQGRWFFRTVEEAGQFSSVGREPEAALGPHE
ncbi:hypothetical protein [Rhizobium rhizogenes]|uniref:hypothetical protein n=1 Tax=Rhizobium rhizogenes TaxID=359 RepID=UPI00115F741B|nr:hypothetical protein [Rhizobium rhizogenes]NTF53266.1 hypothetical protein [Rhizobium rhizogenes]NTF72846.1 hypothetical protein [Rhizobium rhizogenes]NTF91681.1 hypothetical protein [Rhizobium rhizogenes]NTG12129.1 hypothetical protein [Rhizobium rhizogenes]NTH23447.1 hypothetical protein [Rhizobium rhizogenes]